MHAVISQRHAATTHLAKLSVQHEHTYIDGATYKLDPGCPICRAPFSVKGVQRELRGIAFDRSAE